MEVVIATAKTKTKIYFSKGRCASRFFDLHLNSPDGETVFAMDLSGAP